MRHLVLILLILAACAEPRRKEVVLSEEPSAQQQPSAWPQKLSDFGLFTGPLRNLTPADGVIPYTINAPLFSDYALKKRFIRIPQGKKANYHPAETLDFPIGTVIAKSFYYPADLRQPEQNLRILETRLLVLEETGWLALPYVWNEDQTDAELSIAGATLPASWTHTDGEVRNINYLVPGMNQCKNCHMRGDQVMPIGPSARQLNKEADGENQLVRLAAMGMLDGLPADHQSIPRLAEWEAEKNSVNDRARSWLEANCAHCHRSDAPGKTSGLHLLASETSAAKLGIGKAPIAAGKGSGGLKFDVVPGHPEQSILVHRINSTDPGVMMPELGRTMVHREGVDLITRWIREMK
ncbi:MAG: SO2930 family diheme c-type cytochrome [Bacteroidota bacterium]